MVSQDGMLKPTDPHAIALEAWAQGYMVGGLFVMSCVTIANMRAGVLLHKIIFLELILGLWQGFFILFDPPIYAWWLSIAAIFLNMSWSLHNVVAWMKLRPFLSKSASQVFLLTLLIAQIYWVVEIYANFTYFHDINTVFLKTRPLESLFRDPWWIYAAVFVPYTIVTKYNLTFVRIVKISPRFGVLSAALLVSIIFTIVDILSVTHVIPSVTSVGINPFWKLAFVFKCLTDVMMLDDFKTALDRIRGTHLQDIGQTVCINEDATTHNQTQFEASQRQWYGRGDKQVSRGNSDEFGLVAVEKTTAFQVEFADKHP